MRQKLDHAKDRKIGPRIGVPRAERRPPIPAFLPWERQAIEDVVSSLGTLERENVIHEANKGRIAENGWGMTW